MRNDMIVAASAAVLSLLAACGGNGSKAKVAAQATTTAAPTTTVAPAPYGVFPLTGLPVGDPAVAARPALSVKVDNAPLALPQSGLNAADVVTEALVEGGLSRLFVTYHSQDSESVGPIRSARPVDADLLDELNGGIFAYSGAAAGEIAPVKDHSRAVLISDDAGDHGFYRSRDRKAPNNLYGTTAGFYEEGARRSKHALAPPPQLFQYASTPPVSGAAPAGGVQMTWSQYRSMAWTWDAGSRSYQRIQDSAPDKLSDRSMVAATNVVIMSVAIRGTGIFDSLHKEDPLVVVMGQGDCWLMRDGLLIKGQWVRPSTTAPVKLVDSTGNPLALKPGRTWIELLPEKLRPVFS